MRRRTGGIELGRGSRRLRAVSSGILGQRPHQPLRRPSRHRHPNFLHMNIRLNWLSDNLSTLHTPSSFCVRCSWLIFMTSTSFLPGPSACVPLTTYAVAGYLFLSSPSPSRRTSNDRHGHATFMWCSISYTLWSASSTSSCASAGPPRLGRYTSGSGAGASSSSIAGSISSSRSRSILCGGDPGTNSVGQSDVHLQCTPNVEAKDGIVPPSSSAARSTTSSPLASPSSSISSSHSSSNSPISAFVSGGSEGRFDPDPEPELLPLGAFWRDCPSLMSPSISVCAEEARLDIAGYFELTPKFFFKPSWID